MTDYSTKLQTQDWQFNPREKDNKCYSIPLSWKRKHLFTFWHNNIAL